MAARLTVARIALRSYPRNLLPRWLRQRPLVDRPASIVRRWRTAPSGSSPGSRAAQSAWRRRAPPSSSRHCTAPAVYRPRRPHGSQTIVSVGPRRSGERSVWRARQVIDDGGARFGRRTRRSKPRSRPASARGRRRHVRAQPAGRIEATARLEALRGGQAATWFGAAGSGCRKSTRVRSHNSKPSKRYLRSENSA